MPQPIASPLDGLRVLVTRPRHQAEDLCDRLTALGAEVLTQPAIRIEPPSDWAPVDAVFDRLAEYDWLVFSSGNGAGFLLERLRERQGDLRGLGSIKVAAIGPGTADELARFGIHADLVPEEHRAESLAAALAGEATGQRFLIARASRGRAVLAEELSAAGGVVDEVVVYSSEDVSPDDPEIQRVATLLARGQIDWVTVTSSAIARSLARLFGEALRRARLASISPITSQTLGELGFEPAAEASQYTMSGLVEAMIAVDKTGT
jgi:uroporphyrinogen III methyltransferase / synthase